VRRAGRCAKGVARLLRPGGVRAAGGSCIEAWKSQQIRRAAPDGEWMQAAPARIAANSSDVADARSSRRFIVGRVAAQQEMRGWGAGILIQVEEDDEQR